jgi:hypothetical protein
MNSGMLWFDDDPKVDLKAKIIKASVYYHKKYGQAPNLCLVSPSVAAEVQNNSVPIKVQISQFILPHHFWIGVSK